MNKRPFQSTIIVTTLAMLAACSSAPSSSDNDLNAGLDLIDASDDHASGQFTENGTRVQFETARTADGATMAIRGADNQLLFQATRTGDRVDSSYFGGQLTISGPAPLLNPNQSLLPEEIARWAGQVSIAGDATALDRAQAMPEFVLLDDLSRSLDEAGVFADLINGGQLPIGEIEKSADVDPASCGFFKAIACAGVIAACTAACLTVPPPGDGLCVLGCLAGSIPSGCADCLDG